MIILCEGPDGVGKTNISQALASHYHIPYFKVSTEHSNWKSNSFKSSIPFDVLLPQFVEQTGVEFISDRCYISEIVYSRVFKRDTDWEALWQIDREWANQNAIIIMPLRRDYSKVTDELVEQKFMDLLHDEYMNFSYETNCHVIKILVDDYDDDIERQLPVLTTAIEDRL